MWRRAHEDSNLVLQFHHVLRIRRLDEDQERQVRHKQIAERAERDEDEIVLADAEAGADLFRHAHHGEIVSAHGQFLANGINGGKQLVNNILADKADSRVVMVILVGDIAPPRNFFPSDVSVAGGDAVQRDLADGMAGVACLRPVLRRGDGTDGLVARERVLQVLVFLQANRPIAP